MNNANSSLTPQQVADILKITKNTVYELVKRGDLAGYKVGNKLRIDLNDVEIYKNKSRNKISSSNNIAKNTLETSFPTNEVHESNDTQYKRGIVICGQDPMLDILCIYLQKYLKYTNVLRSYMGSYNGLHALYQGDVDVASAHLWDGETGEYNVPFVHRVLPGIPAVTIHLANRMQGFYVAKGNPKKIIGWDDLRRNDITIINREKGSGTRILLDEHLKRLDIFGSSINGYKRESTSHLAIASTVARDGADLGIGIEKTSFLVKDIDFIPLQMEQFDMVIKKEDINKEPFSIILKILNSDEYRSEIEGIGGYDISDIGKIISEK